MQSHIQESDAIWNKLKLALQDTIAVNSDRKSKNQVTLDVLLGKSPFCNVF